MKTIANLVVLVSLFIGQFNGPYTSRSSASLSTPTATQSPTATVPGGSDTATSTPTLTEPSTPVSSETATPTPTLTEPSTPVSSGTATPAPTGTEIPPTPTTPPAEPVIAINLNATPGFVTPGGRISIDWTVVGISPAEHELSLNLILPKGFTPTDKDIKFDEASLTLTIPVLKESGQFGLQADSSLRMQS